MLMILTVQLNLLFPGHVLCMSQVVGHSTDASTRSVRHNIQYGSETVSEENQLAQLYEAGNNSPEHWAKPSPLSPTRGNDPHGHKHHDIRGELDGVVANERGNAVAVYPHNKAV